MKTLKWRFLHLHSHLPSFSSLLNELVHSSHYFPHLLLLYIDSKMLFSHCRRKLLQKLDICVDIWEQAGIKYLGMSRLKKRSLFLLWVLECFAKHFQQIYPHGCHSLGEETKRLGYSLNSKSLEKPLTVTVITWPRASVPADSETQWTAVLIFVLEHRL